MYEAIYPILRITNMEKMRNFEVKSRKREVVWIHGNSSYVHNKSVQLWTYNFY